MEGVLKMPPRRTFVRSGKKIDYKQWAAAPGGGAQHSASATFIIGNLAFNEPATILRWRGMVSAMFDESQQVGDRASIGFGIGVFSTDAVTLGATALPDPLGEPEYPWVWWSEIDLECFVAAGQEAWGVGRQLLEIDSKAMRKVKPGQSVLIVGQIGNLTGAPVTIIKFGQLRVLIGT